MIELTRSTSPTNATFAFAIGAMLATGPVNYPQRQESYEIEQVRGTYSEPFEKLKLQRQSNEDFVQQLMSAYNALAKRQTRLDPEFEAAIYDDLEGLYEA